MSVSVVARRLAVATCLLMLAVPLCAQDDGSGDDPTLGNPTPGNGPGQNGNPPDPTDPGTMNGGGNGNGTGSQIVVKKHQWTAQQLLNWTWDHGYAPSQSGAAPLSEKDAILAMAGHDPRPLLILRECGGCDRDDHKLIEKELANDKTAVYARWYHSVKLPTDVLQPDSPFHAFFTARIPPHMLVATADGTVVGELSSRAKEAELWKLLGSALRKTYKKDPDAAVKSFLGVLDDLDLCEKELGKTEDDLIKLKATKDAVPRDIAKLEDRKKALTDQRTALVAKAKVLDDLQLKSAQPGANGADGADGAPGKPGQPGQPGKPGG
jgi:hypothetical protein